VISVTGRHPEADDNANRSVWLLDSWFLLFPWPLPSPTPRRINGSQLHDAITPEARRTGKAGAMYRNILIPTDGSDLADKAVKSGIAFSKEVNAKITVLTVAAPFHTFTFDTQSVEGTPEEYRKRMHERTAKTLEKAANAAQAEGVACETVEMEHEHPYEAIIQAAKSRGCDLIMMATHGRRGFAGLVRGSETAKVLTHSDIPVLVQH
jgi:nucleotide-binding universal stress UspA family protein